MSSASLVFSLALALNAAPPDSTKVAADAFEPDPAWKPKGKNLWFDPKGRQAIIGARVVLRQGTLEHLLCRKNSKEHEAILATDADPRLIHLVLNLTGAQEGHPVRFVPKFEPPAGSAIAIELQWQENGKTASSDARRWIKDERKNVTLSTDWVFAGSTVVQDPVTKKQVYAADEGDLITVANFASAILDLPFASTANDADRSFVANTEQIPPVGTPVLMFLRIRQPADVAKPKP
jgi:hypothetical protein